MRRVRILPAASDANKPMANSSHDDDLLLTGHTGRVSQLKRLFD